jgi:hypothetical protein
MFVPVQLAHRLSARQSFKGKAIEVGSEAFVINDTTVMPKRLRAAG